MKKTIKTKSGAFVLLAAFTLFLTSFCATVWSADIPANPADDRGKAVLYSLPEQDFSDGKSPEGTDPAGSLPSRRGKAPKSASDYKEMVADLFEENP